MQRAEKMLAQTRPQRRAVPSGGTDRHRLLQPRQLTGNAGRHPFFWRGAQPKGQLIAGLDSRLPRPKAQRHSIRTVKSVVP